MGVTSGDWYERRVEEGIRDVVRLLRDNGVNTICSCHHEMTVECEYPLDGQLADIHNLLYNHLCGKGEPVGYVVTIHHIVDDGHVTSTFAQIRLARKKVERP